MFIKPFLSEARLETIKTIPTYLPAHGESENLCVVSVAPTVCVSRVFVYNAVDVNKIVVAFLIKHPSYLYMQVTAWQKPYLG